MAWWSVSDWRHARVKAEGSSRSPHLHIKVGHSASLEHRQRIRPASRRIPRRFLFHRLRIAWKWKWKFMTASLRNPRLICIMKWVDSTSKNPDWISRLKWLRQSSSSNPAGHLHNSASLPHHLPLPPSSSLPLPRRISKNPTSADSDRETENSTWKMSR